MSGNDNKPGVEEKGSQETPGKSGEQLGIHYLAEFSSCPDIRIADVADVESLFLDTLDRHGATILGHTSHQFEPAGATIVVLLAESHASLHTWPEHDAVCIDIFTCSDSLDAPRALDELADALGAARKQIRVIERNVP